MFTGIITDIGIVRSLQQAGDMQIVIETRTDTASLVPGASVACDGVCLTVTERGRHGEGGWFSVEASAETRQCTTLGHWKEGQPVNLERALKMGDELGGHMVSGHVDAVAQITAVQPEGDSKKFTFQTPARLAKFIAPKGSVTLNGTSLTVNTIEGSRFGVNIIPHTQKITTWGTAHQGDSVNLEVDMLARYVARLTGKD